jgi:hypothetical protein
MIPPSCDKVQSSKIKVQNENLKAQHSIPKVLIHSSSSPTVIIDRGQMGGERNSGGEPLCE